MQPLQIKVEDKKDYVILYFTGTAQAVNKQSEEVTIIRNIFKDLAQQNKTKVVIDMKEVDYMASNTIGALLSGNAILKKIGGKLAIYNTSDYIMKIFNIVKLEQVLPICDSFEEAVETVNQP